MPSNNIIFTNRPLNELMNYIYKEFNIRVKSFCNQIIIYY